MQPLFVSLLLLFLLLLITNNQVIFTIKVKLYLLVLLLLISVTPVLASSVTEPFVFGSKVRNAYLVTAYLSFVGKYSTEASRQSSLPPSQKLGRCYYVQIVLRNTTNDRIYKPYNLFTKKLRIYNKLFIHIVVP